MDIEEMLKQAQQLQEKMEQTQKKLESEEISASAAGGAVVFTITGSNEFKNCKISDDLFNEGKDAVQSAVVAAANEAIKLSKEKHEEAIKELSSFFELPDLKLPELEDMKSMMNEPRRRSESAQDTFKQSNRDFNPRIKP